jgi:hypothetical protein
MKPQLDIFGLTHHHTQQDAFATHIFSNGPLASSPTNIKSSKPLYISFFTLDYYLLHLASVYQVSSFQPTPQPTLLSADLPHTNTSPDSSFAHFTLTKDISSHMVFPVVHFSIMGFTLWDRTLAFHSNSKHLQ